MLEAAISVSALQARHVRACFECPGTLPSQDIMGLRNSSIKFFKKDNFVCIQDSKKYLVKLFLETAYFSWALGHRA